MKLFLNDYYKECSLCPLNCKVDRTNGKVGICGQTDQLKVAWVGLHKEEPPISGSNGSGTIFFSGCSLRNANIVKIYKLVVLKIRWVFLFQLMS